MNREQRFRRLAAINLIAQAEPFNFDDIPRVSDIGQFGNHEILRTDYNLNFETQNLDDLFMQAANKEWISIPDEVRRLGIPHLYYLDPAKITDHEKYFGAKTEYGFVRTPASAALFHAAAEGSVPRKNMSEVKALKIPREYKGKFNLDYLFTLDSAGESLVIKNSTNYLLRAQNNPELLRRFKVMPSGEVELTTSHSRGPVRLPGEQEFPSEISRRLEILERGLKKGLDSYPRLEKTINTFLGTLSNRMDALIREQQNVNRTVRFEGSKEETQDIIRQNILRLIIESLKSDESPLQGSEIYEQDYKII